jgi:hypothetical protein
MPSPAQEARNRLGGMIRRHPDDHEAIAAARADLRATVAEDYIKRLVDSWPPLTAEQRDRLALLLRPGDDHAA